MNWEELRAKHKGQTGVIIGNGPSLKDVPNEWLAKYPSFGTNRIYLKGFLPTYYVSVNPLVIEQSIEEIKKLKCVKFLPKQFCTDDMLPLVSLDNRVFSMNPAAYIYEGFTVTYVCMQIAYYMDFDSILLVGVDHNFTHEGAPNQELISQGEDKNHFHPDYFGKGIKWNAPDLKESEISYRMAKEVYERDNKKIINLTKGTALTVFRKGELNEYV